MERMTKKITRPQAVMTNDRGDGFAQIISSARARKGLTQSGLARMLNVSVSAVGNWEAGLRRPDLNIVAALCRALDISLPALFGAPQRMDELGDEARGLLRRYQALTTANRSVVDRMIDSLLDMQLEERRARVRDIRPIFRSDLKACAGLGNALDEAQGEEVYVHMPSGVRADELIEVTGDSMEPTYHSGDQVLVSYCRTLRRGEIGVFVADGAGYIKELGAQALISHNPAYAPLPLSDFDDVRCIGRVVGVIRPEDYATDEELALLREMEERA